MLRGYEDADPGMTGDSNHGDPNGGAHVAFALQAALWARRRTGRGQLIDLSQAEAMGHHMAYDFMDYSMNRRVHGHWGNSHPSKAPYGVYPCQGEDRWVALAVASDEQFARLCEVMGRPDLASDPRFADVVSRHRNRRDLDAMIVKWTAEHDDRALMQRLQAASVPAAAALWQEELADDPQLEARDYFQRITHPEAGTHRYPGPMAKFERAPLTPPRGPAPCLGQHNEEVLCGLLGLSAEEYQRLVDDQIVGTTYLESAT
jgi:crotonobetainyl-CoA:carnitine CoA-transferase CaiB-like acyl-CoA transferase